MVFSDIDIKLLKDITEYASVTNRTTLLGIDGLSGSGKSTLAAKLNETINSSYKITLDDFYRPVLKTGTYQEAYNSYLEWQRLEDSVLIPLINNLEAVYQRRDWNTNMLTEWCTVQPRGTVIVEGVYTTRPELLPYLDFSIFVDTPKSERLNRLHKREYRDMDWIAQWTAVEDWYIEHFQPDCYVNLVISGFQ